MAGIRPSCCCGAKGTAALPVQPGYAGMIENPGCLRDRIIGEIVIGVLQHRAGSACAEQENAGSGLSADEAEILVSTQRKAVAAMIERQPTEGSG